VTVELNPRYSFETFVVGPSNRLAVAAARTVAESPGTAYNPLFIYSASGLGKTHLMMAIGRLAKEVSPALSVEYLTLEEFVESFHAAVAAGQSEAFRNRFTGVDVVLVDDVHFLANRLETQSELLRFITAFLEGGRQIVLSSDRPPNEIENLDERLISRFAGGLVVDIGTPEFETRLAILRRKADERGVDFERAVLEAIADVDARNVRELIGLLNRLIAFQAVNEGAITPDGVRTLLGIGESVEEVDEASAEPAAAASEAAAAGNEFDQFLSSVGSALAKQMDAWRQRLHEAVVFWEGQGYRAARIVILLEQDTPVGADAVLREYEADVERLQALEREMTTLDAARAGDAVFHDPDQLPAAEELVRRARDGLVPPPGPSAAWAFDDFVEAESNQLALTSARAVAEHPATTYNPLVLAGPTGVGKTHVLHAVGHALSAAPDALVACLSAQDFIDELVQAIEMDRVDAWRSRYRRATALLLDDVHLLAGKERSQEELFHLFNALVDQERQVVFTVNVAPRELDGVHERLISRMEGGLVAEIAPPDRNLRYSLVVRELEARTGTSDPDLAAFLADRHADSLRTVIGTVQRVVDAAETRDEALTVPFARDLLDGGARPRRSSFRMRTSGIVVSPAGGVRSREKVIWRWPDTNDRIIEELV